MEILTNVNFSKVEIVKAGNSIDTVKNHLGETLKMTGVLIYKKTEIEDKTGELRDTIVSCIKIKNGPIITSISPVVKSSLDNITSAFNQDEIGKGIDIVVCTGKSNSKRDFFYIDLV